MKILKSISWAICFFAIFSTFITLEAIASTYYVATDGNDSSGDGSIGSPWETFSYADSQMSGGDTLYVRAGTYTEAIEDLPSGTSWENATILKAYNGESVIIKPSEGNWCFNLTGEYQYIKIEDMAFDAVNVIEGGCMRVKGNRDTSPQKYVHHIRFTNCEAYNSTESNILASHNTHHIEYINCVSHDCGPDPVRDMGFYMSMSDGLLDGCIAYNCSSSGIGVWSPGAAEGGPQNNNTIVRNCKVWHCGSGIEVSSGYGHETYNNVIWDTTRSGYAGLRLILVNDCVNYNNTIYDCITHGIMVNENASDMIIRNNIIYSTGSNAIQDDGTNSVIDHNLTTDPSFTDADGADNIVGNADDDLSLQADSNAIDAGSFVTAPATDVDGKARPQGAAYDIGAYEYGTGGGDTEGPTVPSSLSATSQSESQIDLTWTASTDNYAVTGYRIYRDNVQIDSSTTTSYSDTGLTENTTYSYTVSAYDAAGNDSGQSAASQATTFVDITSPTINSVSIGNSPTQVILDFSEPVEEVSATNVLNYSIDNAITVFIASLGSNLKKVTPTTSEHTDGVTYILTVNNIRDLASIPNVITPDTTVSYAFVTPLISNLTAASGQSYEVVVNGLQNGAMVYIDRSYTYSSVPALLQGATYIKTANNDKGSSNASFLTFEVVRDVIVYVAHDDNITAKPSWLSSFSDTGDNLVTTDTTLSIFESNYLAGTVTLGGNEGSDNSMYTVIIVGQGGTGVINMAPDGAIDTPTGDMTIDEGDTVNFTGYGDDPNGDPLSYLWGFGVGAGIANSTQEDPGPVQFNNPGTYTVTFTVTDSQGLSDPVPDTRTITVQSNNPLVISDLTVASGNNYEVVEYGLQNGALVYIDRSYTYSSVPALLQGATYIKTANDDKGSSGVSFLSFDVDKDVIVYVAHDDFTNTKPFWLSSFTDTGEKLVTTDTTLSIFGSYYPAGTVTLGGNEGGDNSMYSVIIATDATAPVVTSPADVTTEATGAQTIVSIGTATAIDTAGVVSITSNAMGTFPVGTAVVTWTAVDAAGNTGTATQNVTVEDTIAPVITLPSDIRVEAAGLQTSVNIGMATAVDLVDGPLAVSNDAPATFPIGTTLVAYTSTDSHGNTVTATQDVTVSDTTAPVLILPVDVSVEATGLQTGVDIGTATATDIFTVNIISDAPVAYTAGTTVVTWTATDANGNSTNGAQNVIVTDIKAPIITVPADVNVEANAVLSTVDIGTATATDIFDVTINNDAPVAYPVGTTVVTWTATDANGNSTNGTQNIIVTDTKAPITTVPADVNVEANAVLSTVDIGMAAAVDLVDGPLAVSNDAPATFPIGTTVVTYTSSDSHGNTVTATQDVTVSDTTAPVLILPADVSVEAAGLQTGVDIGTATATDIFAVTIISDAPVAYLVGTTVVTWTATDANGNSTNGTQNIIVTDTTALQISNLTAASGKNFEIVEYRFLNGALVYIDRSYTYSTVPTWLEGATYIKTANNDKGSSGASFLSFDVNQDVIVYVAHDDKIGTKPSWLSPFTDTGDNIITTDTTLSIFESYFPAGRVTLGGNEGGDDSMYAVIIVGQ